VGASGVFFVVLAGTGAAAPRVRVGHNRRLPVDGEKRAKTDNFDGKWAEMGKNG
jgi:hypothetical protein